MEIYFAIAGGIFGLWLWWRVIRICWSISPWLLAGMLAVDALCLLAGPLFPVGWILWRLAFVYLGAVWQPLVGQLRIIPWPRHHRRRLLGRSRKREFREPMLWTRGPFSW